mmetsp:Transcript_71951/g.99987  ORF Transcript_71951/g.99987 Transcript_71951/m.99987 type:complete len:115 (-) Transcript_71951:361-705(-)
MAYRIGQSDGPQRSRNGVVHIMGEVARSLQWSKAASIAPLTCTTGTNGGQLRRRLGAAKPTVWDVIRTKRCTTVMQGMRTGERAGLEARRPGAVSTPLEVVSTTARPRNKPGHP